MRFTFYPKKADPRWRPPTADKPEGWLAATALKGKVIYTYNLRDMSIIRRTVFPTHTAARIIPASMRPILQIYDPEDITASPKIFHMWRWIHPDADRLDPSTPAEDLEWANRGGHTLATIGFDMGNMQRLACCAWDETIGRICMVRKDAAHVDVVDLGMTRRLGTSMVYLTSGLDLKADCVLSSIDWRYQRQPLEVVRSNEPDKLPYWYGGTQFDSEDPLLAYCNARTDAVSLDDTVNPEERVRKGKGKQRLTE